MIEIIKDGALSQCPLSEHEFSISTLPQQGWSIYIPMTQEEIIASLTAALEAEYDVVAQTKRYDNRLTCALRAGYAGPFQLEGIAFATWMDSCNAAGYAIMEQVLAGQRPIPTAEGLKEEIFTAWPKPW